MPAYARVVVAGLARVEERLWPLLERFLAEHDAAGLAVAVVCEGQVVARYLGGNPNGSYRDIAGVSNASGSVVGLMPHPEHAVEPLFGPDRDASGGYNSTDGLGFFTSALSGVLSA